MKKIIIYLLISFLCSCGLFPEAELIDSVVIDKHYEPYKTEVVLVQRGYGNNTYWDNETRFVPEKFIIFYQGKEEIKSMEVGSTIYFNLKKGDRFQYWDKWYANIFYKKLEKVND